tara:strand:+ start:20 stop:289 length:270 start_codon:yes stop_codon:yes gene_type:complete
MSTKKLDKKDLDAIQSIGKRYDELTTTLGNLEIEKFTLSLRVEELEKLHASELTKFETIRLQEQDLMADLKERYGEGSIDINTGTFTES